MAQKDKDCGQQSPDFLALLMSVIAVAPTPSVAASLQSIYNQQAGGGTVHTNTGGVPETPPKPPKPKPGG